MTDFNFFHYVYWCTKLILIIYLPNRDRFETVIILFEINCKIKNGEHYIFVGYIKKIDSQLNGEF